MNNFSRIQLLGAVRLFGVLIPICGCIPRACSEGSATGKYGWKGNDGVNRVVWSNPSQELYGSSGNFSITYNIKRVFRPGVNGAPGMWTWTDGPRKFKDQPTGYLGGEATGVLGQQVHFDAGFQFSVNITTGKIIGWQLILRKTGDGPINNAGYVSPKIWNPVTRSMDTDWNGGFGSSISSSLRFEIEPTGPYKGAASLDAGIVGGKIYWNQDSMVGQSSTDPGRPYPITPKVIVDMNKNISLKRAIGLTRLEATTQLSGSTMTGVFSNGKIYWRTTNGLFYDSWKEDNVNQDRTGYDTPRDKLSAWDRLVTVKRKPYKARDRKTKALLSRYIVDFPNLKNAAGQPLPYGAGRNPDEVSKLAREAGVSRYQHETVSISLRQAQKTDEK